MKTLRELKDVLYVNPKTVIRSLQRHRISTKRPIQILEYKSANQ
jgi:hypothetical protein